MTAAEEFEEAVTATLSINGVEATWTVRTRETRTVPNPFSFQNVADANPGVLTSSNAVQITGLADTSTATVSGPPGTQIRVSYTASMSGASFVDAGTGVNVPKDYWLQVRMPSSADLGGVAVATVNVGGVLADWTVTTKSLDTTPDDASFAPLTELKTRSVNVSGRIRITGISVTVPVSATSDRPSSDLKVYVCDVNGSYCKAYAPNAVPNVGENQYVYMSETASDNWDDTVNVTLHVGDKDFGWTLATRVLDLDPLPFNFPNVVEATVGSSVSTTDSVTFSGIPDPVPMTVEGPAGTKVYLSQNGSSGWRPVDGSYSVNVADGTRISLMTTASLQHETPVTVKVTVGNYVTYWTVTTGVADNMPDDFTLTTYVGAEPAASTTHNGRILISGLSDTAPVTVSGSGAMVGVCGAATGSCTVNATAKTVKNGQYIELRGMSSSAFEGEMQVTLNVGELTKVWTIRTRPHDNSPNPFSFTNVNNYPVFTYAQPNPAYIRISGNPDDLEVTATGPANAQFCISTGSSCAAALWQPAGTVGILKPNNYLWVKMPSSSTPGATNTMQITVGDYTTSWSVTAAP